jgi:hypothetical protein
MSIQIGLGLPKESHSAVLGITIPRHTVLGPEGDKKVSEQVPQFGGLDAC